MKSVFEHTDYRQFLNEHYNEKKTLNKAFSHRFIADRVGFKSGGHFSQIISGKANISITFIEKFAEFLKMNKREASYFQNMVLFNQAKNHQDKKRYFEKMMSFKESKVKTVSAKQYEYYDKWFYSAVREVLNFYPFQGDYPELAKLVTPSITPAEARQAIELLERLKLIVCNDNGIYALTDTLITTGYGAQSVCINNHILNTLDLAKVAIDRFNRDERNFSWVALSISEEGYQAIIEELRAFRRKMMSIVDRDQNPDRAYLFNFQVFPLSRRFKKGDKGEK